MKQLKKPSLLYAFGKANLNNGCQELLASAFLAGGVIWSVVTCCSNFNMTALINPSSAKRME